MVARPEDHKKPAKKATSKRPAVRVAAVEAGGVGAFTFTHDGKEYILPSPNEAAGKVPGRVVRDAVMNGDDQSEARLAFATLEASGVTDEALDALYEKPQQEMATILADWMMASAGVTPGES